MKRRDFITKAGLGGVGAAAATTLAAPAVAQERIEMAIVATWGRDFPGLGTGAQRYAQKIQDLYIDFVSNDVMYQNDILDDNTDEIECVYKSVSEN